MHHIVISEPETFPGSFIFVLVQDSGGICLFSSIRLGKNTEKTRYSGASQEVTSMDIKTPFSHWRF